MHWQCIFFTSSLCVDGAIYVLYWFFVLKCFEIWLFGYFLVCFFFVCLDSLSFREIQHLITVVRAHQRISHRMIYMYNVPANQLSISLALFSQIAIGCMFWSCVGHTMNIYFHWKERFWLTLSRQKSHNCWFIQFAPTYRLKNIWLLNHKWMNQITTITMHMNFVQISTFG